MKTRWRVLESQSGSVPFAFLVVVIFWLTVTFTSFGLYAQQNASVTAVMFVSALSVAAAVFLILELDGPFHRCHQGPEQFGALRLAAPWPVGRMLNAERRN